MTIAIDFDGTLVTHAYPEIGKPIPFAIETLKKLQAEGHQLILWSCREGKLLDDAIEYCRQRGLEFYAINSNYPEDLPDVAQPRKLTAELFIDDRNLCGLPDWGIIYQMIHNNQCFRPAPDANMVSEQPKKKSSLLGMLFG